MENVSEIDVQSLVQAMKDAKGALEYLEEGPREVLSGEISEAAQETLLDELLDLNAVVSGCLGYLQCGRVNRQKRAAAEAPAAPRDAPAAAVEHEAAVATSEPGQPAPAGELFGELGGIIAKIRNQVAPDWASPDTIPLPADDFGAMLEQSGVTLQVLGNVIEGAALGRYSIAERQAEAVRA